MSSLRIEQEGKAAEELDFQQLAALDGQIDDVSALIPGPGLSARHRATMFARTGKHKSPASSTSAV